MGRHSIYLRGCWRWNWFTQTMHLEYSLAKCKFSTNKCVLKDLWSFYSSCGFSLQVKPNLKGMHPNGIIVVSSRSELTLFSAFCSKISLRDMIPMKLSVADMHLLQGCFTLQCSDFLMRVQVKTDVFIYEQWICNKSFFFLCTGG